MDTCNYCPACGNKAVKPCKALMDVVCSKCNKSWVECLCPPAKKVRKYVRYREQDKDYFNQSIPIRQ